MLANIFSVDRDISMPIRDQLRQRVLDAIVDGYLSPGDKLPATRAISQTIGVSRNTVAAAYDSLVDEGILECSTRLGYWVSQTASSITVTIPANHDFPGPRTSAGLTDPFPFDDREEVKLTDYRHSFVMVGNDAFMFPHEHWRKATWQSLSRRAMDDWNKEREGTDDPLLIKQISSTILRRRGIWAQPDRILLALAGVHAASIVITTLVNSHHRVGLEDPLMPELFKMCDAQTDNVVSLKMDDEGVVIDETLESCDVLVVSPTVQYGTARSMSDERKKELLKVAIAKNIEIIELDLAGEIGGLGERPSPLKAFDHDDRVSYISSFTFMIGYGLRIGFVVLRKSLIEKARQQRNLLDGPIPQLHYHIMGSFIAAGYYQAELAKLRNILVERREVLGDLLESAFPESRILRPTAGTHYWIEGPPPLDVDLLAQRLKKDGVLISPGRRWYREHPKCNAMRLSYRSIAIEHMPQAVEMIAKETKRLIS